MATKHASFKVAPLDSAIITVIVERAVLEGICQRINSLNLNMDVTAAHANGCPLDLAKLAVADIEDFYHDLFGISTHMNRITGELKNCFVPRSARHDA